MPLNSHGTISDGGDLELTAAKTRIPTQLSTPIFTALSLYNPYTPR